MGAFEREVGEIVRSRFGSIAELARIANLNEQTLHSLFTQGSFANARSSTVCRIADVLEVDAAWLMRGKLVDHSARSRGFVEVPLFSSITAGQPTNASATDERFPIHKELADRYPGAFLLRVSGTSMNRILPDGCYALIEPCATIQHSGQPYAVAVGVTSATIKRVHVLGNGLELQPDSYDRTWPTLIYDYAQSSADDIAVIGRAVWYCLPLNWHVGG